MVMNEETTFWIKLIGSIIIVVLTIAVVTDIANYKLKLKMLEKWDGKLPVCTGKNKTLMSLTKI